MKLKRLSALWRILKIKLKAIEHDCVTPFGKRKIFKVNLHETAKAVPRGGEIAMPVDFNASILSLLGAVLIEWLFFSRTGIPGRASMALKIRETRPLFKNL